MNRLLLFLLCFCGTVNGLFAQPKTTDLLSASDTVLRGTVTKTQAYRLIDGRIFTKVRMEVGKWYKAPQSALMKEGVFEFEVPGGEVGDYGLHVSHTATFQAQEQIVLFWSEANKAVFHGEQGKWALNGEKVEAEKMSLSDFDAFMLELVAADSGQWGKINQKFEAKRQSFESVSKSNATFTDFAPTSAPAGTGTIITINGGGFGTTQGSGKVEFYFDGVSRKQGEIVKWTNTAVKVLVPPGASSGTVKITDSAGGILTTPINFLVTYGANARKWYGNPNTSVTYKINPNCVDLTGEEVAVASAFTTWNAVNTRFQFVNGGAGTATTTTQNNVNDIYWVASIDGAGGIIGRNYNYYSVNTGTITESDVEFDESETWSTSPGSGQQDVQTVALHEIGHTAHQTDYYHADDDDKVMYGYSATGTTKRSLWSYDQDGINAMYMSNTGSNSPAGSTNFSPTSTTLLAVSDSPTFDLGQGTTSFTVEAWIYPTQTPATGETYSIASQTLRASNRGFEMVYRPDNKIEWRVSLNGTTVTSVISTTTAPLNQWSHVRGIFRKSTSNNNRFLYLIINGVNEASSFVGTTAPFNSTANLTFGGYFDGSGVLQEYFRGKIDEIRVSGIDRLGSTTIGSTSMLPFSLATDTNTKGFWKLNDTEVSKTDMTTKYFDHSGLGTGVNNFLFVTGTQLAVSLVNFTASLNGANGRLQWKTESESGFKGFEIQHRLGKFGEFTSIGFLAGTGQPESGGTYEYQLPDLMPGWHSFRLKMVDLDGTVTYSKEAVLLKENPNDFALSSVFPNPTHNEANFMLSVPKTQEITVAVYNLLGQQVQMAYEGRILENQIQHFKLPVSQFAAGLYLVHIKGQYFESKTRFTVVK